VNLDRFSQGIPDQQCANIVGWCSECGMEIYECDVYGENFGIHEECEEELDRIEEELRGNEEEGNESKI
jgi:hypothetical protein